MQLPGWIFAQKRLWVVFLWNTFKTIFIFKLFTSGVNIINYIMTCDLISEVELETLCIFRQKHMWKNEVMYNIVDKYLALIA